MMRGCVVCATSEEPYGMKLDVRGLCAQCRVAYALGRKEALEEVLASALRVRGAPRNGRAENVGDENADGSYSASCAIVSFVRYLLKRRKYPPRTRRL